MNAIEDVVTISPTLVGECGRAWQIDVAKATADRGIKAEDDATVSMWIIEAPWAHPAWHSYSIVLVHLRPMPNQKSETIFYLEGATHEMWVFALNADFPRDPMISTGELHTLLPKNFAAQLVCPGDDVAAVRIAAAVSEICSGKLSPDTDFIRDWARRFGDNMLR